MEGDQNKEAEPETTETRKDKPPPAQEEPAHKGKDEKVDQFSDDEQAGPLSEVIKVSCDTNTYDSFVSFFFPLDYKRAALIFCCRFSLPGAACNETWSALPQTGAG